MINLTREQIYDLVWSKPMTQVASDLGISDVMLGKICKKRNIPRPQRGYWANLGSSKKKCSFVRPELPDCSSKEQGFCNYIENYYCERQTTESRDFDWRDLSVAVPEPPRVPIDSVAQRVEDLLSLAPTLPPLDTYKKIHPVAGKFLASDRRKDQSTYISLDRPIFVGANGQRLFNSLNSLCWTVERLGGEVSIRGRVHLNTFIQFVGQSIPFSLYFHDLEPRSWNENPQEKQQAKTLSIHLSQTASYWGAINRGGEKPLEFNLESIINLLRTDLREREQSFRDALIRGYESDRRNREYHLQDIEDERLETLRKKRERVEAVRARRVSRLMDAVDRMRQAQGIRDLVDKLEKRRQVKGGEIKGFDKWSRWALQHAEQIDPSAMSIRHLERWIAK